MTFSCWIGVLVQRLADHADGVAAGLAFLLAVALSWFACPDASRPPAF